MNHKKGFTLIELLIVIAILGILAAAVVVILNPAELLAQARDGQRIADLDSVKSAVSLYLTDVSSPSFSGTGYIQNASGTCPFTGSCTTRTGTAIDGTGWVDVNLSQISGGSPIPKLPTDPTNNANYFYAFKTSSASTTFEIDGRLESQKQRGKMTTDGGNQNICTGSYIDTTCFYEIGSAPGLNL